MKIQCDACEAVEAEVLCCADEAALCGGCDLQIHALNDLASDHLRLHLVPSSMPICDFCQEALGFFFCLQHRAVVCRKCDITTHKASPLASTHQRLLLTGVKVGLEPIASSSSQIPSTSMVEFLESKGNEHDDSEWSKILKAVDLGQREDVPMNPVTDVHPISTGTMEMEFNNIALLPKFGFLTTHKFRGSSSGIKLQPPENDKKMD